MKTLARPISLAVAAGGVAVLLFVTHVLPSTRAVSVGIVLLAAIAFIELFGAAKAADEPSARVTRRFEEALRPHKKTYRRPAELERVEREIVLGKSTAVWAEGRLIPRLRTATAARLSMRRSIDLERRPEAARELLGEEAWDLVRPDRPEPAYPTAPGVPFEQVGVLLDRLEAL